MFFKNILYHLIKACKQISLFLALIFGCIFQISRSVSSYCLCPCLQRFVDKYIAYFVDLYLQSNLFQYLHESMYGSCSQKLYFPLIFLLSVGKSSIETHWVTSDEFRRFLKYSFLCQRTGIYFLDCSKSCILLFLY